jgi:lipoprotein-anchoring transpeptidase ErfK/SrfK
MRRRHRCILLRRLVTTLPLALTLQGRNGLAAQVSGQDTLRPPPWLDSLRLSTGNRLESGTPLRGHAFRSVADSLDWERARRLASRAREFRVVVSVLDRQLWVIQGRDTLLSAPAAVASGMSLDYAGRQWTFRTPRGKHVVLRKVEDPVWTPPDWVYAEAALEHGRELARWPPSGSVRLRDGRRLVVRDSLVGVISVDAPFQPLPVDEHLVFGDTLYIPPFGTVNRRVRGELGRFAIDLGDGYLIHGTPDPSSIGLAVTHGCIRLYVEHIAWLYVNVPRRTPVYIY